jgi:hypothetical protein
VPRTAYPVVSERVLNRTLLQRQHLLERVAEPPLAMVEHLLGLQAQDLLPPYLSVAARLADPDPRPLSDALAERRAVRVLLMRGTIHLVTAEDALTLRPWVQPFLTGLARTADYGRGFPVERYDALLADAADVLAAGPLTGAELGQRLAARHPILTPSQATALAKTLTPLVQLPPRGTWGASGGQVYSPLSAWLDRPEVDPDPAEIVRRWLRAYGPATPADMTTWSGVTRLRPVFTALDDQLVRYEDEHGRALFDLAGLPLVDPDVPAPVRLLGVYDNLWLSHSWGPPSVDGRQRRHGRDGVRRRDARGALAAVSQWRGRRTAAAPAHPARAGRAGRRGRPCREAARATVTGTVPRPLSRSSRP